jgi:hypothetical protein
MNAMRPTTKIMNISTMNHALPLQRGSARCIGGNMTTIRQLITDGIYGGECRT